MARRDAQLVYEHLQRAVPPSGARASRRCHRSGRTRGSSDERLLCADGGRTCSVVDGSTMASCATRGPIELWDQQTGPTYTYLRPGDTTKFRSAASRPLRSRTFIARAGVFP